MGDIARVAESGDEGQRVAFRIFAALGRAGEEAIPVIKRIMAETESPVRWLAGAYALIAMSGSITTTVPSVTLSAATGTVGGTVMALVTNGPGTPGDWVGFYDTTGAVLQWQYLNGFQTLPAAGIPNATVAFTLPATGTYYVRLFNATYTLVATSTTVTVP